MQFQLDRDKECQSSIACLKKPSSYSASVGESWLAMTISDFLEFQRRLGIFFMPQRKENSHLHQRGGPSSRNISLAFRTRGMRTAKQPIIIQNRTFHTQPSHTHSIRPSIITADFTRLCEKAWGLHSKPPRKTISWFYIQNSNSKWHIKSSKIAVQEMPPRKIR